MGRLFNDLVLRLFLVLSLLANSCRAQDQPAAMSPSRPVAARLVKEVKHTSLIAISPDGSKLCLYFTKHPLMTFTLRGDQRTSAGGSVEGEALNVIQMEPGQNWKEIYSTHQLRSRFMTGSFFGDSETLYLEVLGIPPDYKNSQRIVVNVRTRELNERIRHEVPGKAIGYLALNNRVLLGIESEPSTAKTVALILAGVPDFHQLARVPYSVSAVVRPEPQFQGTGPVIAAEGKTFVHADHHSIVLRAVEDLSVIWTRDIEPELYGIRRLSITPTGNRVAAAILDFAVKGPQPLDYVGVYDGRDGTPLARLPLDGSEGMAISPDARFVAIGRELKGAKNIDLAVEIYDVASGHKLSTVLHDSVPPGRYQRLVATFGAIEFTSDGKYLVTSGNNLVKVWQFDGDSGREADRQQKPGKTSGLSQ